MKLEVNLSNKSYQVLIEKGIINQVKDFIDSEKKVMILSDDGVPYKYIEIVKNQLKNAYVFVFPQGEENKNFFTYQEIIKALIKNQFSRQDYIVALGGGVVSDISGFVASTFKRGMHLINIPTTTLAMVDASVGGKNAVNFAQIKNMIGSFYHPDVVLIDSFTLSTLPEKHFINGTIEALKIGLIGDKDLYHLLRTNALERIKENYEEIIYRALKYKIKIIEEDEKDFNGRKILNYGHTFGHAFESYFKILHGEAIGLGMLVVSKNKTYYDELKDLLNKWHVQTNLKVETDKIIQLIKYDKKCDNGNVDLIIVDEIGQTKIHPTPINELRKFLEEV